MHTHWSRAAIAAAVILTACGGSDSPTDPVIPPAHDPIVFVHGLGGSAADWNPVIARLKVDGWTDRELAARAHRAEPF